MPTRPLEPHQGCTAHLCRFPQVPLDAAQKPGIFYGWRALGPLRSRSSESWIAAGRGCPEHSSGMRPTMSRDGTQRLPHCSSAQQDRGRAHVTYRADFDDRPSHGSGRRGHHSCLGVAAGPGCALLGVWPLRLALPVDEHSRACGDRWNHRSFHLGRRFKSLAGAHLHLEENNRLEQGSVGLVLESHDDESRVPDVCQTVRGTTGNSGEPIDRLPRARGPPPQVSREQALDTLSFPAESASSVLVTRSMTYPRADDLEVACCPTGPEGCRGDQIVAVARTTANSSFLSDS